LNELDGQSDSGTFLKKLDANFHHDETDVGVALLLIQTQIQNSNFRMAASTLEKLFHALKDANSVKYAPGLISLAMVLFPKVGKEDKVSALLMDAKAYWRTRESSVKSMLMK
jgi:signal recognition particle subunit SRP72